MYDADDADDADDDDDADDEMRGSSCKHKGWKIGLLLRRKP